MIPKIQVKVFPNDQVLPPTSFDDVEGGAETASPSRQVPPGHETDPREKIAKVGCTTRLVESGIEMTDHP